MKFISEMEQAECYIKPEILELNSEACISNQRFLYSVRNYFGVVPETFIFYALPTALRTPFFTHKIQVIRSTLHLGSTKLDFHPHGNSLQVHIPPCARGLIPGFPD